MRESLGDDPNTDLVEASVLEVPLSADLVLLAEVLYLVPEHIMDILDRVRAKYLLTSHYTDFDEPVSHLLHRLGGGIRSSLCRLLPDSNRWMVAPTVS
jgi:hypothetical protein